jgi:DMSO reductase anchor subunit
MKPAFSVIFFTVASGAGLGMFALLGLLDLASGAGAGPRALPPAGAMRAAILALALVVAGLCASTLHLANPRNAWRSFARFRTSWLSREAVLAVAFLAAAAIYASLLAAEVSGFLRALAALAVVVLAWAVLICTAMIYASLKPIRQWHTRLTPIAYFVLGHWSGAVLLRAADAAIAPPELALTALALAAAAVKGSYWRDIAGGRGSVTLEQALGVERGVRPPQQSGVTSVMRARLLDAGHTHGTFLTDEFGFVVARRHRRMVAATFWIAGLAVPLAWIVVGLPGWRGGALAGTACMIGMLAERWLFFAQARHTVRLYHGDAAT